MALTPPKRPQATRARPQDLLTAAGVTAKVAIVGIRGYFRDTMGKPGVNDRGLYDDAIFVLTPTKYVPFNANVDPSVYRKHIATLKPGLWHYRVGVHGLNKPKAQRYTALVQAAPVRVQRDQEPEEEGFFGINIHRGGFTTTSSLGCQTIAPEQWASFIQLVTSELSKFGQKIVPYLLVAEQG